MNKFTLVVFMEATSMALPCDGYGKLSDGAVSEIKVFMRLLVIMAIHEKEYTDV